ncbi:putative glycerol-3-phosphate transporter 5 isoform X2 [Prunus yedoensis var. nudiflora]|uniref:Putative glycerol-3-phosphate transporter 5 isoform X2 n=1 Tax=Prunus yedoensis var. nudiflora TaxID=2094558 RepID=A0A314UDB8_PRUYE|nr:putative glycerol-3-phosphate transporter 5 isoform X2 [Prunus yedoensis var. nudiflora]
MQFKTSSLAPALNYFPTLKPPHKTLAFHQFSVLIITFLAYASFHASRKPPSIVKSVLGPTIQSNSSSADTGWDPFNGPHGAHRLGELDLAFLSAYSIGMYFAGHVGDRIDLRLFLVFGMMCSGILTIFFGLGYWFDVHLLGYFMAVQVLCGLVQSIGWPCVVAVVGNWFEKEKRGLIMGVWSSHTSVGNIIGSVVASGVLEFGWGWSFVVPGVLVILVGILVFLFLPVSPEDLGFESLVKEIQMNVEINGIGIWREKWNQRKQVFLEQRMQMSIQLVSYTFLYWLPFYIRHTAVAGVHLSHKTAGNLSAIFDIGGVFGGILAGLISDMIEARAVTSIAFLLLSVPALVFYRVYGSLSMVANILLMFLSGLLVNGPYSLITTAVATDLGTQTVIRGNSRALATVTAIIDGTGSVGAALGPLLAGYISTTGWNNVFLMLIFAIFCATLFLIRIARTEIKGNLNEGKWSLYSIGTQ